MKILFLFCFLLPFSSKATVALRKNGSPCHSALSFPRSNPLDSQRVIKPVAAPIKPLKRRKRQAFIEAPLPQPNSDQLISLFEAILKQKNHPQEELLVSLFTEALKTATSDQLISLFETILNRKNHSQEKWLGSLFIEALKTATKNRIAQFNKNQLVEILYFYKEMGLAPDDAFIHSWREASLEKQREFGSLERFVITSLFKELGIPSLKNPYDLHSGYKEQPFY